MFEAGRLALHLETAYDAFRAHCKRIDYEGEVVDLKALRRLVLENKKQGGLVVAESERVVFVGRDGRRRAVLVDLTRTKVVSADDFPESDDVARGGYSNFRSRYGWNDPS